MAAVKIRDIARQNRKRSMLTVMAPGTSMRKRINFRASSRDHHTLGDVRNDQCSSAGMMAGSRIGVTDKCAARIDTVEPAAVAEHRHKRDAGPGAQILRHVAVRIDPFDRRVGSCWPIENFR